MLGCRMTLTLCVPDDVLAQAHTAPPTMQHYDFTPVEQLLRDSLHKNFDGGCALLLMQDGKIIYERSFGKIGVDSVLPIASGSKWLASALLMTFVDNGTISLNDPISKHLRYLYGTKGEITIKQLFSHTSGFAGEIATMRDMKLTMKDAAYRISTERFAYPPGTGFAYGGASMQLGGRIIEIVGKKSFEELFQERIAKPLGMTHTTFYGLGKTQNPLLAGGAQSSAREYAHFLQMLVNKGVWNGKHILSEFSVADMHLNHAAGVPILRRLQSTSANLTLTSEYANYGLGVWRTSPTSLPSDELIEVGSQGRFGFSPWIDVKRNVIGVLATYTPQHKMQATLKQMKKLLRMIIPPVPQPPIQTASIPHNTNAAERKR
jgi:serine-type D-Ala-D-Ala carboxypeptidase/endopeptidase